MKIFATLAAAAVFGFCAPAAWAQVTTGYENLSFEEVTAKAEAGDAKAQLDLGYRYYYERAHKDDAKAFQWFEKAAAQGDRNGEYELAAMYENGESVDVDPVKAFALYAKAADAGVVAAFADLGLMCLQGDGTPQDTAQAVVWLQKGADAGEARAEALLGMLYRDGTGVSQDAQKALALLKAAVKQRFAPAATMLEEMYRDGDGVAADPITAHAWRTMAGYLNNFEEASKDVPAGGKPVYYYLTTPKLSKDDNSKAWEIYAGFMKELGFVAD